MSAMTLVAKSPSKLNLFLELLSRRKDGFHEIDTVMVAIDLCDDMRFDRTEKAGVQLTVDWWPDRTSWANTLGVSADATILNVPDDESNLVCRAFAAMTKRFDVRGGLKIDLRKRVPAGAGLGGASGNAATTILAVNELWELHIPFSDLQAVAATLGSDVPFFLGKSADSPITAGWCTGRGERISAIEVGRTLHFVVVYPSASLSTARVYSKSRVPDTPKSSQRLRDALVTGSISELSEALLNRLSTPAREIEPRIAEIHKTMWQCGLKAVQLTGSGSASFAILDSRQDADAAVIELQRQLQRDALVMAASTLAVPGKYNSMEETPS